jgi:hypothetical protein
MMFEWIFFGLYRQMAANVPKNLLARHLYVTNQGTTKHRYLRMLRVGLYVNRFCPCPWFNLVK